MIFNKTIVALVLSSIIIIMAAAADVISSSSSPQAAAQAQTQVKGEVMNSKYLQVLDHKYCAVCKSIDLDDGTHVGMRDTITGTIKNIHSDEVSLEGIFAILYGKDGKIIAIEEGTLDPSSSITRAGESTYEIEGLYEDSTVRADFVRYVVVPIGTPY